MNRMKIILILFLARRKSGGEMKMPCVWKGNEMGVVFQFSFGGVVKLGENFLSGKRKSMKLFFYNPTHNLFQLFIVHCSKESAK